MTAGTGGEDVNIGVRTENRLLEAASSENAKITNQIINTLNNMGVSPEKIKTQSYYINSQYDYIDGAQILRGYVTIHELNVTVENISRIGQIIDSAVQNGANQVRDIKFSVKDPSVYYQKALDAAIDDVMEKAAVIGSKLGICVSKVPVQINEQGYQEDFPTEQYAQRGVAASSTQIQTGQIEITARINAIFNYT